MANQGTVILECGEIRGVFNPDSKIRKQDKVHCGKCNKFCKVVDFAPSVPHMLPTLEYWASNESSNRTS